MYFSLSWRNLWRNKKRTLIITASVFFAVIFSSLMRSIQIGTWEQIVHSSAKIFTGYAQIQGNGFWDNRSLDKSFLINPEFEEKIQKTVHVTSITPRLESFALLSKDTNTKIAQIIGIDPQSENNMNYLQSRIIKGEFLNETSKGILLGNGLSERLKTDVGDSLVLYGQGYRGQTAAALLPVLGIVELPLSKLDNMTAYLSLSNAQYIYGIDERITSLSIMIDNAKNLPDALKTIESFLPNDAVLMSWNEMLPELEQTVMTKQVSGMIMSGILYIVIGFGIFGTVMMMTSERQKEFAILVSVGMQKARLIWSTTIETIMFSFLGVVIGMMGSLPIVLYMHNNPIRFTGEVAEMYENYGYEAEMHFSADENIFISQALIVLIIALISALHPMFFIKNLNPVETIKK
ncbi:MAG: ABC transporter permease [Calditrichaeota bacterium]|nr:MAG: ABC transporter permease [Calditrichota bacterium]MBL1206804.1 ABC transporter permease [Calditrichota bacterium]NOG46632.1 ABC transporter permease [Calditrichota bacterium]